MTKNDLFVTLHVPYDMLDPVLEALAETPKVDVDALSEAELRDLETASYRLVTAALEHRPEGVERRGLTLADVAALSPPAYTLAQIQRLFGYVKAVLEADVRPENLKLTPDIEELVRQAITTIPADQRTLFQIVKRLKVGIFKARIVKAVESAGSAVHAPLPTLDLAALGPEFQTSGADGETSVVHPVSTASAAGTATVPPSAGSAPRGPPVRGPSSASPGAAPLSAVGTRCVGCGGLASIVHECGASLCNHCVAEFHTCPKCRKSVTPETSRAVHGAPGHARAHPPTSADGFTLSTTVARVRTPKVEPPAPKPAHPQEHAHALEHSRAVEPVKTVEKPKAAEHPVGSSAPAHAPPPPHPSHTHHPDHARGPGPAQPAPPSKAAVEPPAPPATTASPAPTEAKPPARPAHAREPPDDEPRL